MNYTPDVDTFSYHILTHLQGLDVFIVSIPNLCFNNNDTSKVALFDEKAIRWKSQEFQKEVPLFGSQTHSNIMYKAASFQKSVHTLKVRKKSGKIRNLQTHLASIFILRHKPTLNVAQKIP